MNTDRDCNSDWIDTNDCMFIEWIVAGLFHVFWLQDVATSPIRQKTNLDLTALRGL